MVNMKTRMTRAMVAVAVAAKSFSCTTKPCCANVLLVRVLNASSSSRRRRRRPVCVCISLTKRSSRNNRNSRSTCRVCFRYSNH